MGCDENSAQDYGHMVRKVAQDSSSKAQLEDEFCEFFELYPLTPLGDVEEMAADFRCQYGAWLGASTG